MSADIHDRVFDELEQRIHSLATGAPLTLPDGSARTQADIDAELAGLQRDKEQLLQHWKTATGVIGATPPRARERGRAQPCPHVLELAKRCGII